MNIILLTVDGVLNSREYFKRLRVLNRSLEFKEELDHEKIRMINSLAKETNSKLIILLESASQSTLLKQEKEIKLRLKNIKSIMTELEFRNTPNYKLFARDPKHYVLLASKAQHGDLNHILVKTTWERGLQEEHLELVKETLK